uniref:Inositol monophosphatase 3 n=1 Tax=Parascaris univalens TaxID=6257 RepID=A0A915BLJ3_PARUN
AVVIDNREMQSTVRVDIDENGNFSIIESDGDVVNERSRETLKRRVRSTAESTTNKKLDGKSVCGTMFRPFGILEPSSVKAARSDIRRSLHLACRIATIRYELLHIIKQYNALRGELNYECLPLKMEEYCQVNE